MYEALEQTNTFRQRMGLEIFEFEEKKITFEVKLPEHPLDVSRMTAGQLNTELEKGYADMQAGRTIPANEAFADIRKEYDV